MKKLIAILIVIISFISCHTNSVVLTHNVKRGELLCYKLSIKEWNGKIDFSPEADFDSILKDDEINELIKNNQQYILLKRRTDKLIDISIITVTQRDSNRVKYFGIDPWDRDENKTVRGIINKNGKVESFYLNRAQKNILTLFFEYPEQPVKVNDDWEIEFLMSQISGNFKCKKYKHQNKVTLKEINKTNKGIEAKIAYDIVEEFEGTLNSFIPHRKNPEVEVCSCVKVSGTSVYSITKKHLVKSRMVFAYEGKGVVEGVTTSVHELELMDKVPEMVIEIDNK